MFYEMILFCSLAGVVGAIISLAEINTEKARILQGRGVPAPRVPHCHLAAQPLASPNTWGSASSQPHLPVPVHAAGTSVKMGPSFLPAFYNRARQLQNHLVCNR